jgi:hypothetical protein
MINACRNFLISTAALIAAFLFAACGQSALLYLAPSLSDRVVGSTNLATYSLIPLLAVAFLLSGFFVPRWLRTAFPLGWLLLPIVCLYSIAVIGQPYAYRCNPLVVAGCWVMLFPFVVSAAAVAVGYLLYRMQLRVRRNAV